MKYWHAVIVILEAVGTVNGRHRRYEIGWEGRKDRPISSKATKLVFSTEKHICLSLSSGRSRTRDPIGHNHNAKSEQRNLARRPNERNCFSRMPLAQRSRLTFKRIFVEFSPRGISNPGECRHLGQRDNRATRSRPSWRRLR